MNDSFLDMSRGARTENEFAWAQGMFNLHRGMLAGKYTLEDICNNPDFYFEQCFQTGYSWMKDRFRKDMLKAAQITRDGSLK